MADVDDALPAPLPALRETLRTFLGEEVRAAERQHQVGDEGDASPQLLR